MIKTHSAMNLRFETIEESTTESQFQQQQQQQFQVKKRLDSEANSYSMSNPLVEHNEWIREKLSRIWGDNEADYFVNPNRSTQKINESSGTKQSSLGRKLKGRNGLFAYSIWNDMRDESRTNLKPFELDKELQQTMNTIIRNNKIKARHQNMLEMNKENDSYLSYSDDFDDKIKKANNAAKIQQAKMFRSEIELMYRSSKLNEERVNVMRSNSPLPNINDNDGKESIIRYLPPINLNDNDIKNCKTNSSLEFFSSPQMRHKYKKQLEKKLSNQTDSTNFNLVDYRNEKNTRAQNVRLQFLSEKPFTEYLGRNAEQSEPNSSMELNNLEEKNRSLVLYQELIRSENNPTTYPPLTLNALMEYRPLLKAPGSGDYKHGEPRFFKPN